MALTFKKQLISYLSKRKFKSQSAFTLVELIVVVVIIGILSSIAIPSFQNASDKAKQKEASTLIGSYLKAAQAYYTEYGQLAYRASDLGQYVAVSACRYNNAQQCKTSSNAILNYSGWGGTTFYSPSGNYQIRLERRSSTMLNIRALPTSASGLGAVGCYSTSSGATKLNEMTGNQKGPGNVRPISC
jgi:prepilin-type N-terminal cleavage/methylation domain-containing protein